MDHLTYVFLNDEYRECWKVIALAFCLIVFVIYCVSDTIIRRKTIPPGQNRNFFRALALVVLILLVGFLPLRKTYNNLTFLESNDPVVVKGKVIGFTKEVRDDGFEIPSYPIFRMEGTYRTLTIPDGESSFTVGEVYDIVYIPYSPIGFIYKYDYPNGFVYESGTSPTPIRPDVRAAVCRILCSFYREFFLPVGAMLVLFIFILGVVIKCIVRRKKMTRRQKTTRLTLASAMLAMLCITGILLSGHFKDGRCLADENFPLSVTGEVVRVDDHARPISGRTRIVVSVNGTDEVIELSLADADEKVTVGETYSFLYLPYTHIAEPIEQAP